MKKKILALLLMVTLCLSLAVPCFAASKPAVDIVSTEFRINSVGGVNVTIDYCNNSGKTIKYITWYMTPYNAVGDPVRCSIRGYSQVSGKTTGPVEPSTINLNFTEELSSKFRADPDNPFEASYRYTDYHINTRGISEYGTVKQSMVYADKFNNLFVDSGNGYTYLTQDEIDNDLYDYHIAFFECAWYNGTINSFKVNKVVVEFMDGSKQTISEKQLYGEKYNHVLQGTPFLDTVNQYAAVYNYKDYMNYNPDLAAIFSDNQKALFEHFINNGMKEGRQASSEFILAAYKANNPDLVAIFGDDNAKYYEHYISSGKAEGRKAI